MNEKNDKVLNNYFVFLRLINFLLGIDLVHDNVERELIRVSLITHANEDTCISFSIIGS